MYFNKKKGKACFVCDTPYQLLNILNIVYNQSEFESQDMDLLICNRDIPNSRIEKIKSLNLFGSVFVYSTDLETKEQKKSISFRAKRFFFPEKYVRSFMKNKDFNCRDYDYLICAFPIPMTVAMTMINPDLTLRLFDDGIGTYLGFIPSPDSKKRQLIFRLRRKSSPWSRIECIYVNNKKHYSGTEIDNVIQLKSFEEAGEDFRDAVDLIFGFEKCRYYDECKYVYLTQPLETIFDDAEKYWDIENKVIKLLEPQKDDCVVRKHPKHKEYLEHSMFEDNTNNIWELICAKQITNEHVLIGCYSTAQFSPKFLYNKEPKLIFLFELYDCFENDQVQKMRGMVNNMKESYSDPGKVVIIERLEQLKSSILE